MNNSKHQDERSTEMTRTQNLEDLVKKYRGVERNAEVSYNAFNEKYRNNGTIDINNYTVAELNNLISECINALDKSHDSVMAAHGMVDILSGINCKLKSVISECIDITAGNYDTGNK